MVFIPQDAAFILVKERDGKPVPYGVKRRFWIYKEAMACGMVFIPQDAAFILVKERDGKPVPYGVKRRFGISKKQWDAGWYLYRRTPRLSS